MGQITQPVSGFINVSPIDREAGPGAGAGASGNRSIFLGLNAGQNSTPSNLIVIGNGSVIGGLADNTLNGSTIVGQGDAPVWTAGTGQGNTGGLTIMGSGNALLMQKGDSSVIVGQANLPLYQASSVNSGLQKSVIVGNANMSALSSTTNIINCVAIGYHVANVTTFAHSNCVMIGQGVLGAATGTLGDMTVMGNGAHSGPTSATQDVVIGSAAGVNAAGTSNGMVLLGYGAISQTGSAVGNTVVGANAACNGSSNVVMGFTAQTPANNAGTKSVSIGAWAGRTLSNTSTEILVIETNDPGGTQKALLYGEFVTGNLLVGAATDAGGRKTFFPQTANATNGLGLANGTRGTGNPTGGGFFYSIAGALHWVGSAGTDTPIAPA